MILTQRIVLTIILITLSFVEQKERMLRGMHAITPVNPDFVQHTDSVLESADFLLYLAQCSALEDQMPAVLTVHTLYSNENIRYRILYGFRLRRNIAFA